MEINKYYVEDSVLIEVIVESRDAFDDDNDLSLLNVDNINISIENEEHEKILDNEDLEEFEKGKYYYIYNHDNEDGGGIFEIIIQANYQKYNKTEKTNIEIKE